MVRPITSPLNSPVWPLRETNNRGRWWMTGNLHRQQKQSGLPGWKWRLHCSRSTQPLALWRVTADWPWLSPPVRACRVSKQQAFPVLSQDHGYSLASCHNTVHRDRGGQNGSPPTTSLSCSREPVNPLCYMAKGNQDWRWN